MNKMDVDKAVFEKGTRRTLATATSVPEVQTPVKTDHRAEDEGGALAKLCASAGRTRECNSRSASPITPSISSCSTVPAAKKKEGEQEEEMIARVSSSSPEERAGAVDADDFADQLIVERTKDLVWKTTQNGTVYPSYTPVKAQLVKEYGTRTFEKNKASVERILLEACASLVL